MEITHLENQPVEVLDAVVCDVCGRRVPPEAHEHRRVLFHPRYRENPFFYVALLQIAISSLIFS